MSLRSTSLEFNDWRDNICTCPQQHLADDPYYQCAYCERRQEEADRDSDGTATAAINEDLSVPKDCQARAEGIAQSDMGKPITDAQTPGDTPHDHR
jgi:hypothetical protein